MRDRQQRMADSRRAGELEQLAGELERRGGQLDAHGEPPVGRRHGDLDEPPHLGLREAGVQGQQRGREALRHRLLAGLRDAIPGMAINGPMAPRLAGNLSVRLPPGLRALG